MASSLPISAKPHKVGRLTEFLFRVGLAVKGFDSLLEIVVGILLFTPYKVAEWIVLIAQHELNHGHGNAAQHLEKAADKVGHTTPLIAVYVIFHGLLKVVFIVAALKDKVWGYKGLIAVLALFSAIELTRAAMKHDFTPFYFAFFDFLVIVFIWREYRAKYGETKKAKKT